MEGTGRLPCQTGVFGGHQDRGRWKVRERGYSVSGTALRFLFALAVIFATGCAQKPNAGIAEQAISAHFEQRGYLVKDISIGKIFRNPIAEREYMAPLTYVVEVPSIVLEKETSAESKADHRDAEQLAFSAVTVKIQALSEPQRRWVVSQVTGADLP